MSYSLYTTCDLLSHMKKSLAVEKDPLVLKILLEVSSSSKTCEQIAENIGLERESISRRVTKLEKVDLVIRKKEGRSIVCSINPHGVYDLILRIYHSWGCDDHIKKHYGTKCPSIIQKYILDILYLAQKVGFSGVFSELVDVMVLSQIFTKLNDFSGDDNEVLDELAKFEQGIQRRDIRYIIVNYALPLLTGEEVDIEDRGKHLVGSSRKDREWLAEAYYDIAHRYRIKGK